MEKQMKLSKTRYLNSLSILSSFHTTSSYSQLPLKSKEMKRKKRRTWVLKKEKESVQSLCKANLYVDIPWKYGTHCTKTAHVFFIRVVVTHKYVRSTEAKIFAHGIFTEMYVVTGKLTFICRCCKFPIGVLA